MGFNGAANGSGNGSDNAFSNTKKSKVSFLNYKPTKKGPPTMVIANNVLNSITGATKKNKQFMLDNYERISKNYTLPNRTIFDKLDVKAQEKTYTAMRQNFALNNKNPLGEKQIGGDNASIIKPLTTNTTTAAAMSPTKTEVSQATATDATATDATATTLQESLATKKKKIKAKGRSVTILNKAKGISLDEDLILSDKSLLGK